MAICLYDVSHNTPVLWVTHTAHEQLLVGLLSCVVSLLQRGNPETASQLNRRLHASVKGRLIQ